MADEKTNSSLEQVQNSTFSPARPGDPIHEAFKNAVAVDHDGNSSLQRVTYEGNASSELNPNQTSKLKATPFTWCDPTQIPKRDWLYGRHLIRRNISMTVAPGGVGKSSLTVVQALELVTGRELLGHWLPEPARVWLFNLEDERNEISRRITAAMKHHGIAEADIGDRLYVDTGREQELILAKQQRDEVALNTALIERLRHELRDNQIDVLIVDPFVSSHRVNEMDNGKIDIVAKQWVKLAEECGCAIELVHHTRKLNGVEASSDASRGASSLVNAARSSRVLQRLGDKELSDCGVLGDGCTYFSVKRDKANLASAGDQETYRTVTVELGQGDQVGVVEHWKKPGLFDGLTSHHLRKVQDALDGKDLRFSDQAGGNWAGLVVAETLSLDPDKEKHRIKRFIDEWLKSGALRKVEIKLPSGKFSPALAVGDWA